jgi:hypothetical protein
MKIAYQGKNCDRGSDVLQHMGGNPRSFAHCHMSSISNVSSQFNQIPAIKPLHMKQPQAESITKAAQCADLLVSDIREAHKQACESNPVLELLLRDLLVEASKIKNRLGEIENCIQL